MAKAFQNFQNENVNQIVSGLQSNETVFWRRPWGPAPRPICLHPASQSIGRWEPALLASYNGNLQIRESVNGFRGGAS